MNLTVQFRKGQEQILDLNNCGLKMFSLGFVQSAEFTKKKLLL